MPWPKKVYYNCGANGHEAETVGVAVMGRMKVCTSRSEKWNQTQRETLARSFAPQPPRTATPFLNQTATLSVASSTFTDSYPTRIPGNAPSPVSLLRKSTTLLSTIQTPGLPATIAEGGILTIQQGQGRVHEREMEAQIQDEAHQSHVRTVLTERQTRAPPRCIR
ncbi:hypothetical protein K469DRAFT_693648 [Zopfia rhizophila CBS 207.26]|uniref:Uncharacterized protein n=1 Tax=Zopfia rhizophila CBS 207.26 TaxID=1314779 RepID=A0A6A6DKD0_9PEZI|nr:hypothetical protein K469DRAFT_693648 [Zopfia rhizophila CBS 207.26]